MRLVVSVLAIAGLSLLIFVSFKFGFSRLLTKYSLLTSSAAAANQAVRLTPEDPEAHRARAVVLSRLQLFSYAEVEQERAVSLRPLDDYLWLELGNIREELDNQNGALLSLNQAVNRAPYYAHTHWQRGNLLLRMGRGTEAFDDLRKAARSNRNFVPNLIDLAWSLSGKDPKMTNDLVGIDDDYTRIAFARFLAKNGRGPEVLTQLKAVRGSFSQEVKKDILRQLLSAKSFKEAFEVWNDLNASAAQTPLIYDGGFEGAIGIGDVGFNWLIPRDLSGLSLSQDGSVAQSGTRSLRVTFDGNSNPQLPFVSQTLIVAPQHRYQINLAVRSKNIVTGGSPTVLARDARTGQILGKVDILIQTSEEWQKVNFEISTQPDCDAIVLNLQRNACTTSPCPIFGILWIDSFSIQELGNR